MKKDSFLPLIRGMGIVMMFLWSLGLKAQTPNNPVLTWDQEVGCIEYDDKGERGEQATYVDLLENIENGKCIRFCEESLVQYTFAANNIQHVNWQVTGGTLQPGSTNTNAEILWGASGNGNLTLTVTYTNNAVEVLSVCVEKIIKPRADFKIDGVDPKQNKFCVDTAISFDNLSTQNNGTAIVSYLWDFGDGNFSNTFEPTHSYDTPGNYTVVLTVTNSCNCSDTYEMKLTVIDEKPVEISCASVTCENSRETYSVNDECGGEWKVIGGTIITNNGTSIEVVWDQVDPADGFGYVSYLSKCSCPYWNTVKIPVVLGKAKIKGPDVICQGKQGRFLLPQWPTTDFIWAIDGDEYHPMLVFTDQRNEIVVDGAAPGNYTLSVRYRNTLIDGGKCAGEAQMKFTVVENVEIITDDPLTICSGTSKTFSSHNGMSVSWEIRLGGTVVHTAFGPNIAYTFNTGGVYVVTANNNGCISDPVVVEVIAKPVITGTVSGPQKVCLNVPYTYQISENEPGAIYVWSISPAEGSVVGSNSGTQADFVFTSPTSTIKVVKQFVKNGVICESGPVYFNVSQIVVNATISNTAGMSQFCPSSSATFTANLNITDADHIEWKIVGAGATTNFGSIINGVNSTTVTVGFNEISGGVNTGNLQLYVTKCSETKMFTYPVQLIMSPTIALSSVDPICPSSTSFPITVSTSNGLPASVEVSYNGGPFTGSYSFTSGNSFPISNGFTNFTTNNIAQTLTVRLIGMCTFAATATQTVTIYPLTQIDITPGYHYIVCPTSYSPITLYANISTGITPSVTYEWLKNGINVAGPSTTNQYTISNATQGISPGGTYSVRVVDNNQCVVTSQSIEVIENCINAPGNPCSGTIDPDLSIVADWSSCGQITASVLSPNSTPGSIVWSGSPHLSLDPSTQGTPNALFTTNIPGVHIVKAYVTYGNCTVIKTTTVTKHYDPKVKAAITCSGGSYTVKLLNNSTIFGIDFNDLDFTFSGPGITSAPIGDTYTINGVLPGTYTYIMTVSSPGHPVCTTSVTVTIDPDPATGFSVISPTCSDNPVTLNIPGGVMQPDYEYRWIFNGTSYVANNVSTNVNFDLPANVSNQNFPITLQIKNQYGCVFTSSPVTVVINQAVFDGIINPAVGDFCEGSVTPLSFVLSNPLATPPTNIIWMRDNVQVGTGLTYLPTQSGSYWPILINSNNCTNHDMALSPAIIKVRKPPFASINGSTSVCYGEGTVLTGIYTDSNVQHRWSGPSLPAGYDNWLTGSVNIALNIGGMAPGSYNYSFETRHPSDPTCANSFTVTVVVHPQIPTPVINYSIHNCQPYTLKLTATGSGAGMYNWSNGMTGQTIYVTQGGAYSVSYTAPTGCTVTGYIQAPHNPERSLWIVPAGCYTMCLNKGEYLLGPLGIYQGYEWTINGGTSQSGSNTFIPDQPVTMAGYYQLSITQQGCTFNSRTPHITAGKDCDTKPCKIEGGIRSIKPVKGGVYELSVYLNNPYSYPITVNLSSLYGYGTYSPATVTLNPGINTIYPLYFYTNGSYYPGAPDGLVIQMPDCISVIDILFPKELYPKSATEIIEPQLVLSPNPAYETTTATYNIGTEHQNAQSITVYDVVGVLRHKQNVKGSTGEVSINVSHLVPGTYIVNLEADGKPVVQQKLIKK